MSLAPLPARRGPRERLLSADTELRRRSGPSANLLRRRWRVRILKYVLPVIGLALLGSIALWPEVTRIENEERLTLHQLTAADIDTGEVVDPHYRGVDERGQPYTVTADQARQVSAQTPQASASPDHSPDHPIQPQQGTFGQPDPAQPAPDAQPADTRVNLVNPKGDLVTSSNTWIMVKSRHGVYMQHTQLLDLSEDVVLYRDDGTTLYTDSATMDLHEGAAAGDAKVHAEGPFGTLDAQAFALTDKGDVVQFTGPAHLVVNGTQ